MHGARREGNRGIDGPYPVRRGRGDGRPAPSGAGDEGTLGPTTQVVHRTSRDPLPQYGGSHAVSPEAQALRTSWTEVARDNPRRAGVHHWPHVWFRDVAAIGRTKKRRRDCQPERLSEIDAEVELGRLLDRQLAGPGALEDLIDENGRAPVHLDDARALGHLVPGPDEFELVRPAHAISCSLIASDLAADDGVQWLNRTADTVIFRDGDGSVDAIG